MDPAPSTTQQQIRAWVDTHRDALITFAKRLIATPSANPPGDEIYVARVAEVELRQLGLHDVTIVEPKPGRANLVCRWQTGRPGQVLLLNGHLDTKPPGPLAKWDTDPSQPAIINQRLYGLGAADMKGPNAALAYGLAAASSFADELCGEVILVFSADEEGPAEYGPRFLVKELGLRADAALIAEPCGITRDWEVLPLISRGLCCLRIFVEGTPTHSAISDRIPVVNASLEASRLLLFLDEHLTITHEPIALCPSGPTINLGAYMRAGSGHAQVAGDAEIIVDIRTLPGMTQAGVVADIDRALDKFRQTRPGVKVCWEFFDNNLAWTQPTQISQDDPLVQAVQDASQTILGEAPPLGYFPGGTDAIWWQGAAGIPAIPGFGPGLLPNCHKPNEYVAVKALVQAAGIYALAINNYLQSPG